MDMIGQRGLRAIACVSALIGAAMWFAVLIGPGWGVLAQGYRPNGISGGAALLLLGLGALAMIGQQTWTPLRRIIFTALGSAVAVIGGTAALPYVGLSWSVDWAEPVLLLPLAMAMLLIPAVRR